MVTIPRPIDARCPIVDAAGIARTAGGRGCPGAAWGSQRRGPLGHVFMGRHATPDTARPECSDSRHDLRADVTSPQATVQRDEGYHSNLTVDEPTVNALHAATRALAERANSLLK